jgi:hypothetical protein
LHFACNVKVAMETLARQIERQMHGTPWKHCAIDDRDLERIWRLDEKDREAKIAEFAKKYGFRLRFYHKGMFAIFEKVPPLSAPNLHVPVQRLRLREDKKTWWRWDFALRWVQRDLGSILRMLRMNTQSPNINVIRPAWRRVKKGRIEVRDLKPVTDVKGGGGVKGESKSNTGDTGTTGRTSSHE